MRWSRSRSVRAVGLLAGLTVTASLLYAGVGTGAGAAPTPPPSAPIARKLSSAALIRHYLANPQEAPAASREALAAIRDLTGRPEPGEPARRSTHAAADGRGPMRAQVFNK